jgi:transposase
MTHYAGLDIGLEQTAACIVDERGGIVREAEVATEPEALVRFLEGTGLPLARVGMEACPLSRWLFDGLTTAGLPAVCPETRHLKAALSAMTHETDRNDARGVAQVVRTGWFRAVHVKSTPSQERRVPLAGRRLLVGQRLALGAEPRGSLEAFGLKVGKAGSGESAGRVLALVEGRPTLRAIAEPPLGPRESLPARLDAPHRLVLAQARADRVRRRRMGIPGVGPVTALAFRSAIDAPGRFARSRSVGPHLGPVPRKHQSGRVDRNGRITRCGDGLTRAMPYEAADVLLTRGRPCAPKAWASRVAQRRGFERAKTALARELSVVMHRMWADGSEFRRGVEGVAG